MKTEFKQLPRSEGLLTIELTAEEIAPYEDEAAQRISANVEIPGFRKGQAPKAFVISHIGPDAFFQEVLNVALPRSYFNAVKEKNLQVISRPAIKVIAKSPLKYEAHVALMPEVTLKAIEKIKIPDEEVKITDEEVNGVVEEMRRYRATYKPLERPVQKGDRLEIDFKGYDEGGAFLDKTSSTNHPLFVGEGSLVPGFEDALIGMKHGEKKKFPVKFPKDFHYEPLRSKTVHFETEIKRAEEPILPELNEEFIEQVMGTKATVEGFKEAVKKDMHAQKKLDARKNRENMLLEKFIKEVKVEVPPMLIEEEVDYMIEDLKREVESRKLKFEDYMKKITDEKRDVRKEYAPEAEKRIKLRLTLNYVFRELKIEVSDDDLQKTGQRLLETAPQENKAAIEKDLQQKGEMYQRLKNNLMLEKMFSYFLDAQK